MVGLVVGLVGAASGYTDFHDTYGQERRYGLVDGLTMTVTMIVMLASLVVRIWGGDCSVLPAALATAGLVLALGGAYFRGQLAYGFGTMVNHLAFAEGLELYASTTSAYRSTEKISVTLMLWPCATLSWIAGIPCRRRGDLDHDVGTVAAAAQVLGHRDRARGASRHLRRHLDADVAVLAAGPLVHGTEDIGGGLDVGHHQLPQDVPGLQAFLGNVAQGFVVVARARYHLLEDRRVGRHAGNPGIREACQLDGHDEPAVDVVQPQALALRAQLGDGIRLVVCSVISQSVARLPPPVVAPKAAPACFICSMPDRLVGTTKRDRPARHAAGDGARRTADRGGTATLDRTDTTHHTQLPGSGTAVAFAPGHGRCGR